MLQIVAGLRPVGDNALPHAVPGPHFLGWSRLWQMVVLVACQPRAQTEVDTGVF